MFPSMECLVGRCFDSESCLKHIKNVVMSANVAEFVSDAISSVLQFAFRIEFNFYNASLGINYRVRGNARKPEAKSASTARLESETHDCQRERGKLR